MPEDVSHQQISSYFIGPQAENLGFFEKNIQTILRELGLARTNYFGDDGVSLFRDPCFAAAPFLLCLPVGWPLRCQFADGREMASRNSSLPRSRIRRGSRSRWIG